MAGLLKTLDVAESMKQPNHSDQLTETDAEQGGDVSEKVSLGTDDPSYGEEPKKLTEILVELGCVSQDRLEQHLKDQEAHNKSHFDPSSFIEPKILSLIPRSMALELRILPLAKINGDLLLATGGRLEASVVADLRQTTGLSPKLIIADGEELEAGIKECYKHGQRPSAKEMRLGEYLLAQGLVNQQQLDASLQQQKRSGGRLGELLIQQGYVSEDDVFAYLAEKLGYEHRQFSTSDLDLELSKLLSKRFAERNLVLPLVLDYETKELEVAMAEPYDLKVIDTLHSLVGQQGYRLRPVLAAPSNIKEGIGYLYNFQGLVEDEVEMETVEIDPDNERRDLVATEEMPKIRRIINQVLYRAVVEGASDVHVENLENRVRVRFRMDGLLQERKTPITKDSIRSVISVFKVDAGLDITESRRSQDGVFKMRIGQDHFVDFRINLHATDFGQDAVIRILDTSKNLLPLEGLGCPPAMLERYLLLIENPQGLILFTGPTGSGKSTTLYSTLAHLNSPDKKIVTAEDPVEYYLDSICQYKVNEVIGNTFAEQARRFLRKDPDIILIGEIRDDDTSNACFRAAMTGHLVFSTLHTNDSVGAVERLRNLGVDTSTVAEALLAVISQRLARRACSKCKQPYQPEQALLSLFYPNGQPEEAAFTSGKGCAACDYLGYSGRVGLYEYWELNPEVILAMGRDPANVRKVARGSGLMSLVADGLNKVHQGLTTLEELRRVVPLDQIRAYVNYYAQKK